MVSVTYNFKLTFCRGGMTIKSGIIQNYSSPTLLTSMFFCIPHQKLYLDCNVVLVIYLVVNTLFFIHNKYSHGLIIIEMH